MGCARPDERVRRRGGFKNNRDEGVYVLSAVPPTACKCMAGTTHSAPVQGFRGASCADRSTADCRLPKPEMRVRLTFGAPRPFQTRARILRSGCVTAFLPHRSYATRFLQNRESLVAAKPLPPRYKRSPVLLPFRGGRPLPAHCVIGIMGARQCKRGCMRPRVQPAQLRQADKTKKAGIR